jgi:murein DD-endopeptidase MepM/ murein hydrolase activator NlpD
MSMSSTATPLPIPPPQGGRGKTAAVDAKARTTPSPLEGERWGGGVRRPSLIVLAALALAACVRHAPPAPVMEGQSARPAPVVVASTAPAVVPDTPPQVALAPSRGIAREPVEVTPLEPPPPAPPPQPRLAAPSIGAGSSIPHPPHPDRVVVQTGDTLYAIARRVDVPVRALIEANGLTAPYSVAAGRSLTVPKLRQHVMQPGETLYAVARLFGVDVATLARANDLLPPYTVRVGEVLALPEAGPVLAVAEPKPRPPAEIEPAAGPQPSPPQQSQQEAVATPPSVPSRGGRSFLWPVHGRLIAGYGAGDGGTHNDGINIAAPAGTVVLAADAGTVAYAGNELRGYGNLVLIKHAGGWMTAYAHNSKLLVKRGDKVKRGQPIARVGKSGAVAEPQLHFEIRRGSKPLDPADYLPATPATVSG